MAGLIKVALALENRALPPSLHFTQPNPAIDFAGSPFYVQTALSDWEPEKPRRVAGVSSFGIGGTNAHVVLEEAPPIPASSVATGRQLLTLSAKSPASLEEATGRICDWLATHPDLNLADAAFTLQQGRRAFPYRRVVAAENAQEAIAMLKTGSSMRAPTGKAFEEHASVVFMFPAQGAQHANMGRDLYEREPVFREWMDRCAIYLLPQLGCDLRQLLYPDDAHFAEASEQLKQTRLTQPAVFTLNLCLGATVEVLGHYPGCHGGAQSWGIRRSHAGRGFDPQDATISDCRAWPPDAGTPLRQHARRLSIRRESAAVVAARCFSGGRECPGVVRALRSHRSDSKSWPMPFERNRSMFSLYSPRMLSIPQ